MDVTTKSNTPHADASEHWKSTQYTECESIKCNMYIIDGIGLDVPQNVLYLRSILNTYLIC